jgi:transposase-like protein
LVTGAKQMEETEVKRLLEEVIRAGYSEAAIAARLGTHQNTVNRWRNSRRMPQLTGAVIEVLRRMLDERRQQQGGATENQDGQ